MNFRSDSGKFIFNLPDETHFDSGTAMGTLAELRVCDFKSIRRSAKVDELELLANNVKGC